MLRSLYAGVSGMKSFQTKMDVVANNIANVNTTGFKSGRVTFQDMLSQTLRNAQAPVQGGLGGINGQQVGLGVKLGTIDNIMTNGGLQFTNRELDFAIEGEGFFILSRVRTEGTDHIDYDDPALLYSRDGAFYVDDLGNLVNSSGLNVMGYAAPNNPGDNINTTELISLKIPRESVNNPSYTLQSYNISNTGEIVGIYSDGSTSVAETIGYIGIATFYNPPGLMKESGNTYSASDNSGEPNTGIASTAGFGDIHQSFLEMSNVDLATEFTEMIITSRAYQANSRSITTSDEMLQELINLKR